MVFLLLAFLALLPRGDAACCTTPISYSVTTPAGAIYSITGNLGSSFSGTSNPGIAVVAGCPASFVLSTSGHPFAIQDATNGQDVPNFSSGQQSGTQTWNVPSVAPSTTAFKYQCTVHSSMTNFIRVAADCADIAPPCSTNAIGPTNGGAGACGTSTLQYNQTCSTTCNAGFTANPPPTRRCQQDGTLSGLSAAACAAITCATDPGAPTDGVAGNCGTSAIQYNQTCTTTCNVGYTANPSPTRMCQADGTLSGLSAAACAVVTCTTTASGPTNGVAGACGTNTLQYNQTCSTTCNQGYTANPAPTRRCQADGYLSSLSAAACAGIPCSTNSTAPLHGSAGGCGSTAVTYPNNCTTTCDSGYTKQANPQRQCRLDGTLSDLYPSECFEGANGAVSTSVQFSFLTLLLSLIFIQ